MRAFPTVRCTPPPARARGPWSLPVALALGALACTPEPETAAAPAAATPARAAPSFPPQLPHSTDPRIRACAEALEAGDLARVQELLLAVGDAEAPDSVCLRARLLASNGDAVGAVRLIAEAHKTWPAQGALYATAAEIHAAGGRMQTAQDEVRAGLAVAGPTPDLERARGVLCLLRPGGAQLGLAHLLEARRADPELLFCRGPLSEAHRLLATEALGKQDAAGALAHARAGLELEPDNVELLLLRADALAAAADFDAALPAYEEVVRGGRELGASLRLYYQKGATQALLEQRRDVAVQRYLRARELGASDAELNFGVEVLRQEALARQAAADAAYDAGRFGEAREELARALAIEPRDVVAKNQLGVVCFKLGDYAAAIDAWNAVLALAEEQALELPEPVHLNLARALYAGERKAEIRPLLERYLARAPDGPWAVETREMLARLGD